MSTSKLRDDDDGNGAPEQARDGIRQLPPEPINGSNQPPTTNADASPQHPEHDNDIEASETTPLLGRPQNPTEDVEQGARSRSPRTYWWTIISIVILLIITVNIIIFAFIIPSAAQSYASEATVFSLRNIEIHNFTDTGVFANAQVNITVDASRVSSNGVRNLGILSTNIFKRAYTQPCDVSVTLPQYNGAQVAIVALPALAIDVRNRHVNLLDVLSNVTITDNSLAVQLAGDYLSGRRTEIQAIGETNVHIKAGIIPLGRHHVRQEVTIQGKTPILPDFTVTQVNVVDAPGEGTLLTASAQVANPYPATVAIPALDWKVLVPGCSSKDRIRLTDVTTGPLAIRAGENITVDLSTTISSLASELTDPCSDETPSPLETLLQAVLDPQQNTTLFISGAQQFIPPFPRWIPDILSSLTIPFPLPHLDANTSDLIDAIHCSEMKVTFPSPWVPPGSPYGQTRVSGLIEAVIRPPKEAENVAVNVTAVRADVYLYDDKGAKFGRIVVPEWSPANTTRLAKIHIKTRVTDVPVEVLDPIVFQKVMTQVLRGQGIVDIGVEGTVDAQVKVLIGDFSVRGIPVKGMIEVQGIYPFDDMKPELVGNINVLGTSKTSVTLVSTVKVNNPTDYEAVVPSLNLHILYKGHLIGNATAVNATVSRGPNEINGIVTYAPYSIEDIPFGEEFLGEYLSGHRPNVTLLFHNRSIEGYPDLSAALAGINITIPVPSIHPKDEIKYSKDTSSPFLRSATIHLLSRTAEFELFNPLFNMGIMINSLAAEATYNGELVGTITEPEFNFEVHPGADGYTTTDRIPVEVGTVGYDVIRRALGGQLKVDAVAEVVARVGEWKGRVKYYGKGLGASVRL